VTFADCARNDLPEWDKRILGVEFLTVTLELNEKRKDICVSDVPKKHCSDVCVSLAAELENPETGDVIIEAVEEVGKTVRFYVMSAIVCRYEWFKAGNVQSLSPINATAHGWRNKRKPDTILEAPSKAARTTQGKRESLSSSIDREKTGPKTDHRKIIALHGRGETVHNLLYYVYTGMVNLHCDHKDITDFPSLHPKGYPPEVDALDLHTLANEIGIDGLEKLSLDYARKFCTVENVLTTLTTELGLNDSLIDMFVSFIKDNYDAVKKTPEWEQIYNEVARREVKKEREYLSNILLRISKDAK
jgi:hypothetical protein